jgi:putative endonuclease
LKSRSRLIGDKNEEIAVCYLQALGFCVIDRNVSFKTGELDIVATKNGILHSIEVKSGSSFDPIYNMTPLKLKKVIDTTQWYMKSKGINSPFVIDLLLVRNHECEFIENITM